MTESAVPLRVVEGNACVLEGGGSTIRLSTW